MKALIKFGGIERLGRTGSGAATPETPPIDPNAPVLGHWYWVQMQTVPLDADGCVIQIPKPTKRNPDRMVDAPLVTERWLGCVVHVGSNFARVKGPRPHMSKYDNADTGWSTRILFTDWSTECTRADDAQQYIDAQVGKCHQNAQRLMGQVQELTKQLGVGMTASLGHGETAALAMRDSGESLAQYKGALMKAKTETLPALFEKIKEENARMGNWLKASLIPLKVGVIKLKPTIRLIESRVFNVELYAGLVEQVTEVREGKPAPLGTKLHVLQRRHYMDEECLLNYRTGGMEFKNITAFDRWMAEPKNFVRLLPHPRCLLAFKVRRFKKERETLSIGDLLGLSSLDAADQLTFLYIRNGEKLFRLSTEIDFSEQLFPDMDAANLSGPLRARRAGKDWDSEEGEQVAGWHVITQHAWEVMKQEEEQTARDWPGVWEAWVKEETARHEAAHAKWLAVFEAKIGGPAVHEKPATGKENGRRFYRTAGSWSTNILSEPRLDVAGGGWYERDDDDGFDPEEESARIHPDPPKKREPQSHLYFPFEPAHIDYDSVTLHLKAQMEQHNRVVLVLQGLFDRSTAFHPHGVVRLWEEGALTEHLSLIYDVSRVMVPTQHPPDFEAYRVACNASLKVGSVTVGQEDAWRKKVVAKEEDRRANNWRYSSHDRSVSKFWTPEGDPGPGLLATVMKLRAGEASFAWTKTGERRRSRHDRWGDKPEVACTISVPISKLFNVSAYKPGDFKQFFEDPRTRADYLKWAPLLLEAEEFHAGNRKVGAPK